MIWNMGISWTSYSSCQASIERRIAPLEKRSGVCKGQSITIQRQSTVRILSLVVISNKAFLSGFPQAVKEYENYYRSSIILTRKLMQTYQTLPHLLEDA